MSCTARTCSTPVRANLARRRLALTVLTACMVLSGAGLVGCASNHPITNTGEACASCHSDGREAAADAANSAAASATETGLTFAVESAGEVHLCIATVAEDGTIIPARMRTLAADELGAVTVSEPGLYALCAGDISSPTTVALVNAIENGPADAAVKL